MSEAIIEQESEPNPEISEGMRELRESAGSEVEAEATESEATRDEKGRFAAKAESKDDLLLGKFRSVDDLAAGYSELEQALGRQGQEIGQLRQYVTEQPQSAPDQGTIDWFDEQIEQNPQGAAVWALQNDRSGALYNRAMDAWYNEQPRQAGGFEREMEMSQLVQAISHQQAPLVQQAQQQEFVQAWQQAFSKIPDLSEHVEEIMGAAETAPEILIPLQRGSLADKQRVIENLYWLAKGRKADTLTEATQQYAFQQAQSEKSAAQAAAVAPTSSLAVSEDKGGDLAKRIWGTAPPSISEGLTYK